MNMPVKHNRTKHTKKKKEPVVLSSSDVRVKLNQEQYYRLITPAYGYWQEIIKGKGDRFMLHNVAIRIRMLGLSSPFVHQTDAVNKISTTCLNELEKLAIEYSTEYLIRVDPRIDYLFMNAFGVLEQAVNLLSRRENFTNFSQAIDDINKRRIFGSYIHE